MTTRTRLCPTPTKCIVSRLVACYRVIFVSLFLATTSYADLAGHVIVPGDAIDLSGLQTGLNGNRLGGFGSDLYYDQFSDRYYGLSDAGPARGFESRLPRIEEFSLSFDPATGSIGDFQLRDTILFKASDGSQSFDALNPLLQNGDASELGMSLDPEGLAVGANGNFFVADEYGPSVYEFARFENNGNVEARLVRALETPANIVPFDSTGAVNYLAERETKPELVRGRQDGRGFEGLALSPDGSSLFGILQAPLANEGDRGQGRRSRNLRIVQFDVESGASTAQYIYRLEDVESVNSRVLHEFEDKHQGRRIGVSAIRSINDHEFLVLERDNRGLGPENPTLSDPEASDVGSKRIYRIDISGATDVRQVSLAGSSFLPANIQPVSKTLVVDVQSELASADLAIPEKTEGLAIGPRLHDGRFALLVSTDNDLSGLQFDDGSLVEVYLDGTTGPVNSDPAGRTYLPSHLFSFPTALGGYEARIPDSEPLLAGDADRDGDFDQLDLVLVQQAAKYLTGLAATWGEGDWDGGPGTRANPQPGDGVFDQKDVIASLTAGIYLTGPYSVRLAPGGQNAAELDDAIQITPMDMSAVPEPASITTLLISVAAASLWRRRRQAFGVR